MTNSHPHNKPIQLSTELTPYSKVTQLRLPQPPAPTGTSHHNPTAPADTNHPNPTSLNAAGHNADPHALIPHAQTPAALNSTSPTPTLPSPVSHKIAPHTNTPIDFSPTPTPTTTSNPNPSLQKPIQENPVIFGPYIPKRLSRSASPAELEYSRKIISLKYRNQNAIDFFAGLLEPALPANRTICVVPSHNSQRTTTGISLVAQRLCQTQDRRDATTCLQRHTSTPRMSNGIWRSEQLHFESISVFHPELIADQDVILLDDVVSSGCSMRACRFLLQTAGAKSVVCYALSKTVKAF